MEQYVEKLIDRTVSDYASGKNLTKQEAEVLADSLIKVWKAAIEKKRTHRDDLYHGVIAASERLASLRQSVTRIVLQSTQDAHIVRERSLDCPLPAVIAPDLPGPDEQLNLEDLKEDDNELLQLPKELAIRVGELTNLCAFRQQQQQKLDGENRRCRPICHTRPLCKQVAAEPQ